ncbi:unnamed protein product, partial [Amoebophrya sp. A120]
HTTISALEWLTLRATVVNSSCFHKTSLKRAGAAAARGNVADHDRQELSSHENALDFQSVCKFLNVILPSLLLEYTEYPFDIGLLSLPPGSCSTSVPGIFSHPTRAFDADLEFRRAVLSDTILKLLFGDPPVEENYWGKQLDGKLSGKAESYEKIHELYFDNCSSSSGSAIEMLHGDELDIRNFASKDTEKVRNSSEEQGGRGGSVLSRKDEETKLRLPQNTSSSSRSFKKKLLFLQRRLLDKPRPLVVDRIKDFPKNINPQEPELQMEAEQIGCIIPSKEAGTVVEGRSSAPTTTDVAEDTKNQALMLQG